MVTAGAARMTNAVRIAARAKSSKSPHLPRGNGALRQRQRQLAYEKYATVVNVLLLLFLLLLACANFCVSRDT